MPLRTRKPPTKKLVLVVIDALKPAMESQKAQMKQLREAQEAKVLSILTPDQQAQYKSLKAEWAAKRAQKRSQQ